MYAFLDESGSPGVALNNNDFLVISLVLFYEADMERSSELMAELRAKLHKTADYEFHFASNSTVSRREFVGLMRDLNFSFITVGIKKNHTKRFASYAHIADILTQELLRLDFEILKIMMDSNPVLHTELRRSFSRFGIKGVRIKEVKSHKDDLVQLADYVANISAKRLKHVSGSEFYRSLDSKKVSFIEIT